MNKDDLTDAVICREGDTVLEVSRILRDTMRRHLIVLDAKDHPIGIISTVDLNSRVLSEEKDPKSLKAKDIMTKNIQIADLKDTYEKAFQVMIKLGTHSIPVVENHKLIGLIEFTKAFKLKRSKS